MKRKTEAKKKICNENVPNYIVHYLKFDEKK